MSIFIFVSRPTKYQHVRYQEFNKFKKTRELQHCLNTQHGVWLCLSHVHQNIDIPFMEI